MSFLSDFVMFAGSNGAAVLVDASLKATALLLSATIAARVLRSSSAAARHRVWSLGLSGALVMPLVSLSVPQVRFPVLPPLSELASVDKRAPAANGTVGTMNIATDYGAIGATDVARAEMTFWTIGDSQRNEAAHGGSNSQSAHEDAMLIAANRSGVSSSSAATLGGFDFCFYACGVWLAGVLCVLIPLAAGFAVRNRVLLESARRLDDPRWVRLIGDLSARIGLKRSVAAFESPQPIVPITWGCWRPAVLVPIAWRDWSEERRRCVLLHELAHVKRFDVALQIIGRLAAGFYWFNPLAWYAVRQLRIEREFACDDCVLESGERPTDYARELVEIARLYRVPHLALGAAMANSDRLDERVLGILDPARFRLPLTRKLACSLFVAAAAITFGLAATNLVERRVVAASPADASAGELSATRSAVPLEAAAANQAESPANQRPTVRKKDAGEEAIEPVTIQGRVTDGAGKPVPGAMIQIVPEFPGLLPKGERGPQVVANADRSGAFEFTYQPDPFYGPTKFQMSITAEGYGLDWWPLADVLKRRELTVSLEREVPVHGRILTLEGRPVVGATVSVRSVRATNDGGLTPFIATVKAGNGSNFQFDKYTFEPPQLSPLTTDAEGRFRLTGVGQNRVVELHVAGRSIQNGDLRVMTLESAPIQAEKGRGFADFDQEMGRPPVFGATFEWVARPSRLIVGTVVDAKTSAPLSGIYVSGVKTGLDGRFELTGHAKAKDYYVSASPGDQPYLVASKHVRDTPGLEPLEVTLEMTRGIVVNGRVTDRVTGKPVAANLGYYPLDGNENVKRGVGGMEARGVGAFAASWTDRDGKFSITVLPGPGFIGITGEQRDRFQPANVDVVAFAKKENVLYAKNPPGGLDENLLVMAGEGSWSAMPQWNFNEIELLNLPVGTDDSTRREIQLRPAIPVTGVVLDPEGQPLQGTTAIGLANHRRASEMLDKPEFTVTGLGETETRTVFIRHEGERLVGFAQVTADTRQPLRITLQPWGEVSGRFVSKEREPLANLEIGADVVPVEEELMRNLQRIRATDDKGRFRIDGMVPGLTYTIRAFDREKPELKIVVKPGEKLDVGDVSDAEDSRK